MFKLIRKIMVLSVVAVASIALWEAGKVTDLAKQHIPDSFHLPFLAQSETQTEADDEKKTVGQQQQQVPEVAEKDERETASGLRWLAWAVFVLLLPVVTGPLAGHIIDKESNAANVVMLFGYTGLGILALHFVCGVQVVGILSAVLYLVGLLALFAYNLWICGFIAGLRER